MNPKEKAEELFDKMYSVKTIYDAHNITIHEAKQCALIAVEEILEANPYECDGIEILHSGISYWEEVKKEIEKL
jgi:hypothetical protein